MRLLIIVLTLIATEAFSQDQWKNVYSEGSWAERDQWQRPDEIIDFLNLSAGSSVADIGCHEGYMTMRLAKKVGPRGEVYAIDIDSYKLEKLRTNAADRGFSNVTIVKGNFDNPNLVPSSIDAALILDTYHEMDAHDAMLKHIKSALKPGGRIVICEPIAETCRGLTREEQERRHELGMEFAVKDLERAGFKILTKKDPFIDRKVKGDQMWIVVAVK